VWLSLALEQPRDLDLLMFFLSNKILLTMFYTKTSSIPPPRGYKGGKNSFIKEFCYGIEFSLGPLSPRRGESGPKNSNVFSPEGDPPVPADEKFDFCNQFFALFYVSRGNSRADSSVTSFAKRAHVSSRIFTPKSNWENVMYFILDIGK